MSWIGVSERLPEEEAEMGRASVWWGWPVVWTYSESSGVVLAMYYLADGRPKWEEYQIRHSDYGPADIENVTHWMPINKPEPPK